MKLFCNFTNFISGVLVGYGLGVFSCLLWWFVSAETRFTSKVPQNNAAKDIAFLKGKTRPKHTIQHRIGNSCQVGFTGN
jgi:hypothetical protein